MRIAYLAHLTGHRDPGVINKIAAQVAQWRDSGHEVRLFIATRDDPARFAPALGDAQSGRFGSPISRLIALTKLIRAIRRFRPSLVYMRWDLFYPPMFWLPADAPLVVEVNTDDLVENALGSRLRSFYNRITRGFLFRRARALVFVTAELSHRTSFGRHATRHVITNGIDLTSYPVLPALKNDQPRLVFVGSPDQPWQGLDKVITLASIHRDWQFDIVGLRDRNADTSPNISWHGRLGRADLISVLSRADVGLGTLALHRKAMDEAASLKVREYLAFGLPVIYANVDLDVDGLGPLVLRIANTETNVVDDLPLIEDFVRRSRGTRIPRSQLRHIDVARKEAQRLALFETLART